MTRIYQCEPIVSTAIIIGSGNTGHRSFPAPWGRQSYFLQVEDMKFAKYHGLGLARQYGPLIETDSRFPHRTNVQFLEVLDRQNIRIEIWERGAGYTLASGSSSTAAAAVAGCPALLF